MEVQNLLNDAGDIDDDIVNPPPPVPGPAHLLKLTNDEIHLGLLHSDIKFSANVPLDPKFKAIPRAEYRPFQLCLPVGFKASALAFFKLFFTNAIFDILVQNTNLNACEKEAQTS
jgi:hypothetical protein